MARRLPARVAQEIQECQVSFRSARGDQHGKDVRVGLRHRPGNHGGGRPCAVDDRDGPPGGARRLRAQGNGMREGMRRRSDPG